VRSVEAEIARTEERLKPLDSREQALRKSLDARHDVLVEVLAVLQRIGRQPPPVLMVKPEDALKSVRSAMLLAAVLPEMRQETETLLADLSELARLRKGITEERERLERDLKKLADENPRLTMLIAQRQKQQTDAESSLASERQRTAQLAGQAGNLNDLVGSLERNLDGTTRGVRLAARSGDEKKALDSRPNLGALKDPGRLAPAIAFASAKKTLPLPVNGVKIKEFGASDGLGGTEKGLSIATRHGNQVTAPCDGWVVYAGPYRNYGQLLILNAGDGYHVLLAGMERISVDLGQFVVTGEPVAVMGSRAQAAATVAAGSGQPVLYVEFRKDGTPVDPGPWWAASEIEKVRG
jgi:septal ring factor EnvC (AmiA/AmiB activator)